MLSKIRSAAVVGLTAVPVTVEVDIAASGLPSFTVVGLPDKAVEESRERVRAAIRNSGAEFPAKRITVNLAPADLPKNGPAYDLPIAVGILAASGQLGTSDVSGLIVGALSLDGSVLHTTGMLPVAIMSQALSVGAMFVPACDAPETAVVDGPDVIGVPTLAALIAHMWGSHRLTAAPRNETGVAMPDADSPAEYDFADIVGQSQAKRALEIAAAGGHNVFMVGPPGAGKTLLARSIPSILPVLTRPEAIEVTNIYSVTGNLPPGESLVRIRPFRSPHHTTSRIGLIGGGTHPMPGEISLAHRGVLFLDEFPEFPRSVLEALRQPMEDGVVAISRASGTAIYPAKFMLVAAANPCPCGNYGSSVKRCTCQPGAVERYRRRISGPILDRIDLTLQVPAVETERLTRPPAAEPSASVRMRVQAARDLQGERYSGLGGVCNADLSGKQARQICRLGSAEMSFMASAVSRYGVSARSYCRILKVARTIADLRAGSEISIADIAEAVQFRMAAE